MTIVQNRGMFMGWLVVFGCLVVLGVNGGMGVFLGHSRFS